VILSIVFGGLGRCLIRVLELLLVVERRKVSNELSICCLAGFKWSVHVIDWAPEPVSGDYGERVYKIACEDSV
jgi:hypothetical protein